MKDLLKSLQTLWFALAFVSIGLEARFSDLVKIEGGRPALAFIGAQLFNIIWTLLWALDFIWRVFVCRAGYKIMTAGTVMRRLRRITVPLVFCL